MKNGMGFFSLGVVGVKVEGSLRTNQEDVVCSDFHHSFLDGLPIGIRSPV